MRRTVSIVEARRDLGRLADEVRRTGRSIVLTRRGRPVASIAPELGTTSTRGPGGAFAPLRGTVRLLCDFDELQTAVRELRGEFTRSLQRRARSYKPRRTSG